MKKLPIGTQTFDVLRNDNSIYVDKTQHIFNLISNGRIYFLSRPRRFGKSLLVSTFKELFKANKDLFKGLYIYDKWDWSTQYPVIHLDFAKLAYDTPERLENSLSDFISRTAIEYSIELISSQIQTRFSELIEMLHQSIANQVIVLIDEYDKPLIDNLNDEEIYIKIKKILHNFYQVIKAGDAHLKFVFMTGVSQFSGLSIFSGLNNLYNITMSGQYCSICGYTQEELENNFKNYIEETAQEMKMSVKELLSNIKYWYNGYSWDGKTYVYNPFSTLVFFRDKEFKDYWFETATPTFLVEQVEKKNDLYIQSKVVGADVLRGSGSYRLDTTPLLFQTGYLTVKKKELVDYEPKYTIDFPNMEVKKAFLSSLLTLCARKSQEEANVIRDKIVEALKKKSAEELQKGLVELFTNIAYDLMIEKEAYYHSLFLIIGSMSGYEVSSEVHTNIGRIDAVLKKGKEVIVAEIKYGKGSKAEKLLKEAMEQIRNRKYYEKYASSQVSLLAVAFGDNKEILCKFEELESN